MVSNNSNKMMNNTMSGLTTDNTTKR